MANLSTYLDNALINAVLRNTTYTSPATVYVALYTSDPTVADSGTEVTTSGTAYVRQSVTFAAPSAGSTSNSGQLTYPVATASYGTVSHVGVRDASTAGNLLWFGPLTASKTIATGDQFIISAGNLTCSLS